MIQGAKTVTAYFPKDTWYSLDYEVIKSNGEEKTKIGRAHV